MVHSVLVRSLENSLTGKPDTETKVGTGSCLRTALGGNLPPSIRNTGALDKLYLLSAEAGFRTART